MVGFIVFVLGIVLGQPVSGGVPVQIGAQPVSGGVPVQIGTQPAPPRSSD